MTREEPRHPAGMNKEQRNTTPESMHPQFRKPNVQDGAGVWRLIRDAGVLDLNSSYLYLMLSHYFRDTCILVEHDDQVVGYVSSFVVPQRPDTLFVWQVAVAAQMRGQGIGTTMLLSLLSRPECQNVSWLETTVTADNQASEAMFRRLSQSLSTELQIGEGFPDTLFPDTGHESERLLRIGPFDVTTCKQNSKRG